MSDTGNDTVGACTGFQKKDRPVGSDYIRELFDDFVELHGDRLFGDDKAVVGGIAQFCGEPVTVIAQEKGTTTKEILRGILECRHRRGIERHCA